MVGYRSPGMSVPEMLTELIAGGMSNGQAAHELARAIEDGALTLIDKTDVHAWSPAKLRSEAAQWIRAYADFEQRHGGAHRNSCGLLSTLARM